MMDFEDIPSPMAFPVPKRGKRTLVGLALSLFIVATYWYFPSRWFKVDNLNTPRYVDNDWDRLDEIRSLIYFTQLPHSSSPDVFPPANTLSLMRDDEDMLAKHLTPYTFGAFTPEAIEAWKTNVRGIDKVKPLVIFSKTYCPYSKKVKALFENYDVDPKPLVIEVDLREDGDVIKAHLKRLTGHNTFPNVLVQTRSLGGSDDMESIHRTGTLSFLLRSGGLTVRGPHHL